MVNRATVAKWKRAAMHNHNRTSRCQPSQIQTRTLGLQQQRPPFIQHITVNPSPRFIVGRYAVEEDGQKENAEIIQGNAIMHKNTGEKKQGESRTA